MKLKNSILKSIVVIIIMLLTLIVGQKVFALEDKLIINNPDANGPIDQKGNTNYFCIEHWNGWSMHYLYDRFKNLKITYGTNEEKDGSKLEASVAYGLWSAMNKGKGIPISTIQYLIWSSGKYQGLDGYIPTLY